MDHNSNEENTNNHNNNNNTILKRRKRPREWERVPKEGCTSRQTLKKIITYRKTDIETYTNH